MAKLKLPLIIFYLLIALTNYSQPTLLGMTREGGDGAGVIFGMTTGSNSLSIMNNLGMTTPGSNPINTNLLEASNGKFYGLTGSGGANNSGVIFEFDAVNNSYLKIFDFNAPTTGGLPTGSLIQAANGKLYGVTAYGGTNNMGVLFEFDITTYSYVKKLDFNGSVNGNSPRGTLVEASNGKLYGMTYEGGVNNSGVIFEYDFVSNTFTKKFDLNNYTDGRLTYGSLIQASNNKLYGMTSQGGTNDMGVLFEFDITTNSYIKKLDFSGTSNGQNPHGSLCQGSNGKLYGMTANGGLNGFGVLFEFDPVSNNFIKKIDFNGASNGKSPRGDLFQANNGKFYGMTFAGGANDLGIIFEYDAVLNSLSKKIDFNGVGNGHSPESSLIQATNGKLFGLTENGGINNKGVLFEYDFSTNTLTKKQDFNSLSNGFSPLGSVVKALNGKLYGLTSNGGINNKGVLFEYDLLLNTYVKKIDFNGTLNGESPYGSLIQASNGKLYGMTTVGGTNNQGTIFEYDISTNTLSKKHDFSGSNGIYPQGTLIQVSNGKLYGLTVSGGINSYGVIFEYDIITNTYTKKYDFSVIDGGNPYGSLIQAGNGKLYGLTFQGGSTGNGVLFEYDFTNNTYTKKVDFNNSGNGQNPYGTLCEASNGKLYGLTRTGGLNGQGVLFEYDPSGNVITKKHDFIQINGMLPRGSVMQASNGKLYGMTQDGGANNFGVVFEFDLVNNLYTKKLDFNGANGKWPFYGHLIETTLCNLSTSIAKTNASCFNTANGSATVTVSGGGPYTYSWSPATGTASVATGLSAGIYTVYITGANSCSTTATVSITQPASLIVTGSQTNNICNGGNAGAASVTVSGGTAPYSYSWSPSGNPSHSISNLSAGNYTAFINDANNCVSNYTFNITQPSPFVITTSVNPIANICIGSTVSLHGMGANSYTWTGGITNGTVFTPSASASYTVSGTNSNGCIATAVQTIAVNSLPSITVTVSDPVICQGYTTSLFATGAVNYTYTPFITNGMVFSPSATTIYTVSGTSIHGCVNSTIALVTVNPLPVVSVNSGSICAGEIFTITPTGASTYTYINGSATVSPASTTSYSVIGSSSAGCVSSNTAVASVSVYSLPVVSVNSGAICSGETFTIIPTGAASYTFSNGSAFVNPTVTTSYSVSGTSNEGCISSSAAVANVTVNSLPLVSVNSGSMCMNCTFTLIPSGAATYTFSNGSATVSPSITTSFSVTGTSAEGCVSSNTAVASVTVVSLPVITVNSGSICAGESFTINPSGALSYTFSNGSAVVSPTVNSTYSVSGSNSEGCVSNLPAVSSVTVFALPVISLSASSASICAGQSVTITASGAITHSWSTGNTANNVVLSPTVTSQYTVNGSNTNGCVGQSTVEIQVEDCTGINENSVRVSFLIYPNPNSGEFKIEAPAPATIVITNALGEVIYTAQLSRGLNTLNMVGIAKGLYFANFSNPSVRTTRLIIQ